MEGETEGKTCERGAAACVEENGVGSSCGEGKENGEMAWRKGRR